ncbi:MAG: type II secretion system F family protein [Steroidobacteraceae bacterium]
MRFTVKTYDVAQGVLVYAIDAPDESDARRQVMEEGRKLISLVRQATLGSPAKGRISLVIFSQELIALLDAGISLVEAIETLTEKESQPAVRRTMEQIRSRLYEGRTLSSALAELPHSFPQLYVATIRASERSGAIRESLTRYVTYQQQVDVLRKKLVNASIYPLVLAGAGALVTFFLLGYVVPRFSGIYEDLGSNLPFASRMLMHWGRILESHGTSILVGTITLLGLAAYGVTRPAFRASVGRLIARVPAFGRQLHTYQLARMYRTVGMLLRGGIPAVTALNMSEGLLSPSLRPALSAATLAVREGRPLASSLEQQGLTTPVAVRMLRVGERSGNMGEMMERVAAFYDDELARALELLTRLIEPALMTLIGLVIGVIVVLMYFPIFELAGSLQ